MKLRTVRSAFTVLLPCVGVVAFGALTVLADPPVERVGEDAPHQERNQAKNERKTALPLTELNVPKFADTQKPVRKATAVDATSSSTDSRSKAKAKKKAEQQQAQAAKAKAKAEAKDNFIFD